MMMVIFHTFFFSSLPTLLTHLKWVTTNQAETDTKGPSGGVHSEMRVVWKHHARSKRVKIGGTEIHEDVVELTLIRRKMVMELGLVWCSDCCLGCER